MGFFSKLKKVVAGVDKGAAIAAASLPGKAGTIAGEVGQTAGVVTAIVQQIQAKPEAEIPATDAQKNATLVTAVAVDDHEERIKELEQMIQNLRSQQGGQPSPSGQSGQTGTPTKSAKSAKSAKSPKSNKL
ncbi:MAG TPA: hypothetical protein VJT82_02145 [Pyrinomonadaceae bacterium]|nr:hypothetical protein [Pyrinomonadaceae bacterium]